MIIHQQRFGRVGALALAIILGTVSGLLVAREMQASVTNDCVDYQYCSAAQAGTCADSDVQIGCWVISPPNACEGGCCANCG